MKFHKYHALGNDYLVLDPQDSGAGDEFSLSPREVQVICHRNYGLGSDGILWGPMKSEKAQFGLRIFNPDGGEAEKSGNGLRIFARYLHDTGRVSNSPFTVHTPGGKVKCEVASNGLITVEMGQVSFSSRDIPVKGSEREVINETIVVGDKEYTYCAATIGNPHCVLPLPEISAELVKRVGPVLEREPRFPNRTNVQLLKVLDRRNIQIEIWERGAGYTLASGSSSSAAGAVARKLGLVDEAITVHMPGGKLSLRFSDDFSVTMTGPATRVGQMTFDLAALDDAPANLEG